MEKHEDHPKYFIDYDGQRIPWSMRPVDEMPEIPEDADPNEQITAVRKHLEYIVQRYKDLKVTLEKRQNGIYEEYEDDEEANPFKKSENSTPSVLDQIPDALLGGVVSVGLLGVLGVVGATVAKSFLK